MAKSKKPDVINPKAIHPWALLVDFDVTAGVAIDRAVMITTRSTAPGKENVLPKTNVCQNDCH